MLPPHPPFPSPPPPPAGVSVREIALIVWLSFTIALPFVVVFFICMLPWRAPRDQVLAKPPREQLSTFAKLRRKLSKPFYRWAFLQGRRFTDESIAYFTVKYMRKYLIKRRKLKLEGSGCKMSSQVIEHVVQTAAVALRDGADLSASLRSRQAGDLSDAALEGFAQFASGLHAAASTNIGLSHAKAREYWIYRGPRYLLYTVCFISGVFVINEVIRRPTFEERVVNVSGSMLASLTTFIMLYYRLPDSIRSGVCRSAHDAYAKGKKELEREAKAAAMASSASAAMISPSSASELETTDNEDGEKTTKNALSQRTTRQSRKSSKAVLETIKDSPKASPYPHKKRYDDRKFIDDADDEDDGPVPGLSQV